MEVGNNSEKKHNFAGMSDKKHLRFMKKTILLASGLIAAIPFVHAQKNKDKKPNVVFILAAVSYTHLRAHET